jgi:hypothetical protein
MAFVVVEMVAIPYNQGPTGSDPVVPVRDPLTGLAKVIASDASLTLAITDAAGRTSDDSPVFGPILGALSQ